MYVVLPSIENLKPEKQTEQFCCTKLMSPSNIRHSLKSHRDYLGELQHCIKPCCRLLGVAGWIVFQVLLGDTTDVQECVTFIYRGRCLVVREVYLKKTRELQLLKDSPLISSVHRPPVKVKFI